GQCGRSARRGVRLRRLDWGLDHADAFAAEDLVEGLGELRVPIVDEEAHPSENVGEAEVARLLGNPRAGWVPGPAGEPDPAAVELDEEQDVEAAQGERLDGEEVAGEHAPCLRPQKRLQLRPLRR